MSPVYSKRGQRSATLLKSKGKLRVVAGQSRVSVSLGVRDPRLRRNPQGATKTERQFSSTDFTVDKTGRIQLRE